VLLANPVADFLFGAMALYIALMQPIQTRPAFFGRQNLDALAVFERGVERHDLAVDLGTAAAVAQIGVQVVSKIDRGRTARQRDHLAGGREHIDVVVKEFGFERIRKLTFLRHVFAPVEQLAQPGNLLDIFSVALTAFLVAPVRGHAVFGMLVHVERADLDFNRLIARADHGRVQALVMVALGLGDIVVKFARNRLPEVMDDAEYGVTVAHRIDQHAHRAHIVNLGKIDLLLLHLFPDAVDVLGATHQVSLDAGAG